MAVPRRHPIAIVVPNDVFDMASQELSALARDVRSELLTVDPEVSVRELEAMIAGAIDGSLSQRERRGGAGRYSIVDGLQEEAPFSQRGPRSSSAPPVSTPQPVSTAARPSTPHAASPPASPASPAIPPAPAACVGSAAVCVRYTAHVERPPRAAALRVLPALSPVRPSLLPTVRASAQAFHGNADHLAGASLGTAPPEARLVAERSGEERDRSGPSRGVPWRSRPDENESSARPSPGPFHPEAPPDAARRAALPSIVIARRTVRWAARHVHCEGSRLRIICRGAPLPALFSWTIQRGRRRLRRSGGDVDIMENPIRTRDESNRAPRR